MESDLVRSKSIASDRSELLQQRILESVATHKCYSVKDLVVELQHTYGKSMSIEEIQNAVKKLESEKKITLLGSLIMVNNCCDLLDNGFSIPLTKYGAMVLYENDHWSGICLIYTGECTCSTSFCSSKHGTD
jgi:hypothetical protein